MVKVHITPKEADLRVERAVQLSKKDIIVHKA